MRELVGVAAMVGVLGLAGVGTAAAQTPATAAAQYPAHGAAINIVINTRSVTVTVSGYAPWTPITVSVQVRPPAGAGAFEDRFHRDVTGYAPWSFQPGSDSGSGPAPTAPNAAYPVVVVESDGNGVATATAEVPDVSPGEWIVAAEGSGPTGQSRVLGAPFVVEPNGAISVIPQVAPSAGGGSSSVSQGEAAPADALSLPALPVGRPEGVDSAPDWIPGMGIAVGAASVGVGLAGMRRRRAAPLR